MKNCLKLMLLIFISTLLIGCSQQQGQQVLEKKKLVVGVSVGYYPFVMMDKNCQLVGYEIDLAKAMAESLGMELNVQGYNGVANLISAVQAQKADLIISGITITDKRKEAVDFSVPYFESYHSILIKNQYNDLKGWEELDKPDVTIAVANGSSGEVIASKMFKQATLKKYDGGALAGLELLNGQAAAMVHDDIWVKVYQIYNSDKTSILTPRVGEVSFSGIAVAKGDKEMLDKINKFLKQYKGSETERKSYQKWVESDSWKDLVPPKK